MTGLLICAAVVALVGSDLLHTAGQHSAAGNAAGAWVHVVLGLALIAAALYLAWRAGGAV